MQARCRRPGGRQWLSKNKHERGVFWKPQRKLSSPLYPQGASQGGCSIIAIKLSREKEFGQRCFSCQLLWVGACAPTHSWMCASLLNQPLLLSPWSLLRVTNHRRTGFQTRVGLPATSSSEASSRFFFAFEHQSDGSSSFHFRWMQAENAFHKSFCSAQGLFQGDWVGSTARLGRAGVLPGNEVHSLSFGLEAAVT